MQATQTYYDIKHDCKQTESVIGNEIWNTHQIRNYFNIINCL